jgi:hypothetical protein
VRRLAFALIVLAACSSGAGKAAITTLPTSTTQAAGPSTTLDAKGQFVQIFEKVQSSFVAAIAADPEIQAVNKIAFVLSTNAVLMDVTSKPAAPAKTPADNAWHVLQLIAPLWAPGQGFNRTAFVPGLHLVNSGADYRCTSDFMVRLAAGQVDQATWPAQCT